MGRFSGLQQLKAAHHVHTRNSDGAQRLYSVLEDHYSKNYDIVMITDHDSLTPDWVTKRHGLTQERFDEMAIGLGRDGRSMLQIPNTNEQSTHDHVCTYFTSYHTFGAFGNDTFLDDPHFVSHGKMFMEFPGEPEQYTLSALQSTLQAVQSQNGLSILNHPGRYTGGQSGATGPSNDQVQIDKYADLFLTYSTCVGMSIINKKDGESRTDRILWDNINSKTIPQGKYVWGFSNDDTHYNHHTGFAFNVMVMPENTEQEFRKAMKEGSFYAVSLVARREGVGLNIRTDDPLPNIPTPLIKDIEVTKTSITISAQNYTQIDWITDGTAKIPSGPTVDLSALTDGSFVRANVIGSGGIAFSQPFSLL